MKNPNGYGSVFKLSGNRRKPWCARITVGWTDEGKQQYKNIGYYEERSEAMIALAQYNNDPYDLDSNKITFAEVYEKWSEEKFPKISDSNIRGYKTSFNKCSMLHNMKFKQIRKMHMQRIINENSQLSYQVRMKLKTLFSQLYQFGIENDIVEKDYSKFVEAGEQTTKLVRTPFSDAEIETLWRNLDKPYVDSILIMIYSGMRVGELVKLNREDINFVDRECIVLGKGNKQRKVYFDARTKIHLQRYLASRTDDNPALFVTLQKPYNRLQISGVEIRLRNLGRELNLNKVHPHKFRRTLATMAIDKGMPIEQVQQLLGHQSVDTTLQYAMVNQANVKSSHRKFIG